MDSFNVSIDHDLKLIRRNTVFRESVSTGNASLLLTHV